MQAEEQNESSSSPYPPWLLGEIYTPPPKGELFVDSGSNGRYHFHDQSQKVEDNNGNYEYPYSVTKARAFLTKVKRQLEGSPVGDAIFDKGSGVGVYFAACRYDDTLDGRFFKYEVGPDSHKYKGDWPGARSQTEEIRQLFHDRNPRFTMPNNGRFDAYSHICCGALSILDILHLEYFMWRHNLGYAEAITHHAYEHEWGMYGKFMHDSRGGLGYNCNVAMSEGADEENPYVLVAVVFEYKLHLEYPTCRLNYASTGYGILCDIVNGRYSMPEDDDSSRVRRFNDFAGTKKSRLREMFEFFHSWRPEDIGANKEEFEQLLLQHQMEGNERMRKRRALGPLCYSFTLVQIVCRRIGAEDGLRLLGWENGTDVRYVTNMEISHNLAEYTTKYRK